MKTSLAVLYWLLITGVSRGFVKRRWTGIFPSYWHIYLSGYAHLLDLWIALTVCKQFYPEIQIRHIFKWKILLYFLFLHKNIYCGYSFEAPQRGASNEYPQHMFSLRNKINIYMTSILIWSSDYLCAIFALRLEANILVAWYIAAADHVSGSVRYKTWKCKNTVLDKNWISHKTT